MLDLSITCKEVRYATEIEDEPNLLLEIEHRDKSSALLSPPNVQAHTANGLVCYFDYQSISSSKTVQTLDNHSERRNTSPIHRLKQQSKRKRSKGEQLYHEATEDYQMPSSQELYVASTNERGNDATVEVLRGASDLALAAIHNIFGAKRRFHGIRQSASKSPSLLELAPAVFNSQYMHVRKYCCMSIQQLISLLGNHHICQYLPSHIEYTHTFGGVETITDAESCKALSRYRSLANGKHPRRGELSVHNGTPETLVVATRLFKPFSRDADCYEKGRPRA